MNTTLFDQMTRGEMFSAYLELESRLFPYSDQDDAPSWHKDLLDETERRLDSGEETTMTWEEAKGRLQAMKKCR